MNATRIIPPDRGRRGSIRRRRGRKMSAEGRFQLLREFDQWGFDHKGWSKNTRLRYYSVAMRCDRWLNDHKDTALPWAKPAELQAFLFAQTPTARNRNNIRQGLVAFGEFLVYKGFAAVNPASSLPRL